MNEQIRKVGKDIVEFWKKRSKKAKILIISGIVALIAAALVLTFLLNKKDYVVLFNDISKEETVEVMQQLQDNSVEYKYENDGTILIPKKEENMLRMKLAESGHPRTGSNYDLFIENIDFMTTDYEKKKYEVFQLQERLQDSIKTIEGVKEALVTINVPQDKKFAWETDKEEASASVKINLVSGKTLSQSQVNGIIQLISKSVQGLKSENIAILDTDGNSLSPDDDMLQTNAIKLKMEIERQFEKDTENNVKAFLATVYGPENVQVSSNCQINFDKKISEMLKYLPEEETKSGVPSEKQNEREVAGPGETVGGVPGTDTNAEVSSYPGVTIEGDDIYFKDKSTINYLVSQLKEQIEHNPGNIENLTVAVVINKKSMNDDEKNKIRDLVANSSGIDIAKVSLHNMEFYNPDAPPAVSTDVSEEVPSMTKNLLIYGGIALGVLVLLIIIISIILRKKKKKKAKEEALKNQVAPEPNERDYSWVDVQEEIKLQETPEQVIKKQLKDFTKNNPEISAQLIRTWIKGEDE